MFVQKPCVSVAYDPSGRCVAVGTTVGRFIVLDAETGGHWVSVQLGTESLDVVRFSPGTRRSGDEQIVVLNSQAEFCFYV